MVLRLFGLKKGKGRPEHELAAPGGTPAPTPPETEAASPPTPAEAPRRAKPAKRGKAAGKGKSNPKGVAKRGRAKPKPKAARKKR